MKSDCDRYIQAIPPRCPITNLPFFMVIEHPDFGWVSTYGGPYDSYTIPELEDNSKPIHEREFIRFRYDHDCGSWVDGGEAISMRLITEGRLFEFWESEEELEELRIVNSDREADQ